MNKAPHPSFSFHIESGEPQGDVVPASVLVQILQNAQQAFELIGVHVEGRSINQRARVSAAVSQRFQLVCQLPQPGCYALPVTVGSVSDRFAQEQADKAFHVFHELMERVSNRTSDGLEQILPDERVRRRVNYAALDVEELGSVYESLLDERPSIDLPDLTGWRTGVRSES